MTPPPSLSLSCIYCFLAVLLAAWPAIFVRASSPFPLPLTTIDHPTTLSLEILPRSPRIRDLTSTKRTLPIDSTALQHSDRFRLKFTAFHETFNLHLSPNDDLIHPAAKVSHFATSPSGGPPKLVKVEPLLRQSVLAYSGYVVHSDHTEARLREDTAGLWHPFNAPGNLGWARIMIHHQGDASASLEPMFEGAFSYGGVIYHIMPKERYLRTKLPDDPKNPSDIDTTSSSSLVVFRDSDLLPDPDENHLHTGAKFSCGHDHLAFNSDFSDDLMLRASLLSPSRWDNPWRVFEESRLINRSRVKRDDVAGGSGNSNFVSTIGSTTGCPKNPRLVYMGVAADCRYTAQHGSVQNATSTILSNWNTASALYKSTFNVSLGIINIEVHEPNCPVTPDTLRPWNVDCGNVTLNERLSLFSTYRATLGDDGAGLWHLMSGCPTGTEVGVAWLGTLCNQQASSQGDSVVSGTAVSTAGRTEWQVVAHEIGHNFGAIHDCQSGCGSTTNCCPLSASSCDANSQFLMSPVTSAGEMNFSPCSIGNICSLMQPGTANGMNTSCLLESGAATKTVISLQMCGNGIVEAGEDCDPGSGTSSKCCDSTTCKFTPNSKCDPLNDACCTDSCQLSPAGQVCRAAISGGCDIAETCTGNSSKCPADTFKPNGMSCGANSLACASGQCTSISQQCAMVGMSMNLSKACPNKNSKTCQISCQNPDDSNSCVVLQSQLIDGSPCGYGGTCIRGNCNAGPLLDTVKAWYVQNLQISIPVTIVVAIVAIILIWSLIMAIRRSCAGSRRQTPSDSVLRGPVQRIPSWPAPPLQTAQVAVGAQNSSGTAARVVSLDPYASRPPIPAALRAGPSASLSRSPMSTPWIGPRSQHHSTSRTSRIRPPGRGAPPPHWVDPTPWNGPQ